MADDVTGTPEPASGTTAQAADGAASDQAGGAAVEETPEQLRARIAELESTHKQDLARLSSGEEAKRRLDEIEARLAAPPPSTAASNADAQLYEQWQTFVAQSPEGASIMAAKEQMDQRRFNEIQAQLRWDRELAAITDLDERKQAEERARKLNVSPAWALRDLRAERWDKERTDLAERERKLREAEDRARSGVVRTTAAPAPPTPATTNEMKASAYAQKQRELQNEGKMEEAIALKRRREAGELKLLDG